MRLHRGWPMLVGAMLWSAIRSAPVTAQATFEWPARAVDYTRYRHPEQCLSLANRLVEVGWRGEAKALRDTARYDPQRDTLPTRVMQTVRRCVANVDVETAQPFELPWLLRLYLIAGQDDQVEAVVARQLALARTPEARATTLLRTVTTLLADLRSARIALLDDAWPAWITLAKAYAAQLDSMGAVAWKERKDVHLWPLWRYIQATLDTALMRSNLAAYEAALADGGAAAASKPGLYGILMSEKVAAVLDHEYPLDARAFFTAYAATHYPGVPEESVQELIDGLLGKGRPQVAGDFWFQADTARPVASAYPRPGKVSFLVFVGEPCGGTCAGAYAVLRRLKERFGDSLEIVLMARTMGYFRQLPPPSPAEEAELTRQYFFEDVKLADVLSVVSTPFTHFPDPDGRYFAQGTPNLHHFGYIESDGTDNDAVWSAPLGSLVGYFTGPDGEIKERALVDLNYERLLNFLAAKMIATYTPGARGVQGGNGGSGGS